jgi:phage recombination protein Bet
MNALVEFEKKELALIRNTVAKDCSPQEFDMFIHIAKAVGLDPLRRQIYAFVFGKGKKDEDRQLTVVTAIDGYRTISERSGNYRPDDKPPRYTYDETLKSKTNPHGIETCTVSVYKYAHGGWHEVPGFVYWDEFVPTGYRKEDVEWKENTRRDGSTYRFMEVKEGAELVVDPSKTGWVKMGRNQIAKCAEAQAHRKAFPNDFSGVLVEEEIHQRMSQDLTASEAADLSEKEDRMAKIGGPSMLIIDWIDGKPLASVPADKFFGLAMDFINGCEGQPGTVRTFRERNQASLRQYWGIKGDEALKLKAAMEEAEKQPEDGSQIDLEECIAKVAGNA